MVSNASEKPVKGAWSKSLPCLYRYVPTGEYFARLRFGGKLIRRKLGTHDYQLARRKLSEFKGELGNTDPKAGKTTFGKALDIYAGTLGALAGSSQKDKRGIIKRLRETWPGIVGIDKLPLSMVKPSDIAGWLSKECGDKSASYYNSVLSLIRSALDMAVDDRVIPKSPAAKMKYRKRAKPIRQTPTFEEFQAIMANIRAQKFNRDAQTSADFVEFLGLAGLGQAEVASLTRADVDLAAGRIALYRHKTSTAFFIPIFPQVRPLVERLCAGKAHNERLFHIREARKALANACTRLKLPSFTHRALRRMFVTRALERGVDVLVISQWQGHKDGGKLILQTYSHIRRPHSDRMAALMTDSEPENVVSIKAGAA